MKEVIQRILGLFGVRLARAGEARKYLPKPTLENIELVARFYSMTKRPITVLQVGACDGVTSDSIYPYIRSGDMKAFLVEPGKVNFGKLAEFYKEMKDVVLINVAVSDRDEARQFYTVKDDGRWRDSGWARQLASFNRDHLLNHKILESEIQSEEVRCMTLRSIVQSYDVKDLDVLLIDTEGYDGEIVKMALDQGITPKFIAFENAQIVKSWPQEELNALYALLAANGYDWTNDRINTLAVHKNFFDGRRSRE